MPNPSENSDINFLFKLLDKQQSHLITELQAEIVTVDAAFNAVDKYDRIYFSNLPASVDFKATLAENLLNLCGNFGVKCNLWSLIKNKHKNIIPVIDICVNKNNFI